MLDPRVYRAGLIPALLALIIAAFSIQQPQAPVTATLPPDSFSGTHAFATLQTLAAQFPDRRPGGDGDAGLAERARAVFRETGYRVSERRFEARTARGTKELRTVMGVRAGTSSRRLVVIAHRDSLSRPATADLSGTATLLELASIFEGRNLRKTLVLVSTSGASGGAAGAAEAARHLGGGGTVDAVIVLGDLAGRRVSRPVVVPWSNSVGVTPLQLRRTLETAVRQESGLRPGGVAPPGQFARLAFPLTVSEQGELASAGLPAVMLSTSGELGPGAETRVSRDRLGLMGRAVLRSITALDAPSAHGQAPRAELYGAGKVLPGWAVRLLVGALILPVLLAAVDGFARVRRRRHPVTMWVMWVLAGAIPFAAALSFGFVLTLVGLIPRPPAAAPLPAAFGLHAGGYVAMACVTLVGAACWLLLRPAALRLLGVRGDPGSPGAAAALSLVLVAIVAVVWLGNPFAAALLVAPLHVWLLMTAPEVRIRRLAALFGVLVSLVPLALVAGYYAVALDLSPLQLAWYALLLALGGHLGLGSVAGVCLLLGCLGSVLAIVRAQGLASLPDPGEPMIRGPVSYAGPGSLGGTESALRR